MSTEVSMSGIHHLSSVKRRRSGTERNTGIWDEVSVSISGVKQFHPDVNRDVADSDSMIQCVIEAYEILSNYSRSEIIERECLDPFEKPECEAFDIFVGSLCWQRVSIFMCKKGTSFLFICFYWKC
nr:uncharacterized protein LOC112006927 isoform X1 [Quercus suber]XP_023895012.1 uncharacterized protein LOC112006927 isoform X1 [Quercus suber]